jgi:hypothetical protein
MSLRHLELTDDLDELVRQWIECGDESKRGEIAESHYWHRESLKSSDKLGKYYLDFSRKLSDARHIGRNYNDIYWEIKNRHDGKRIGKLFKGVAIIVGVGIVLSMLFSLINTPRPPEQVQRERLLRQRYPYDPADDPRSESNGYQARGL